MISRRRFLSTSVVAAAPGSSGGAVTAELELRTADAEDSGSVPARVLVRDSAGNDHVPPDAVAVPIHTDRWFLTSGIARLRVPAGKLSIRVERGTEYAPVKQEITVSSGTSRRLEIKLQRWINMRRRGWVSGENHLHVPLRELPAMLASDDLNFGTSLYWWNGPHLEPPPGPEPVRGLEFGGRSSPASVFDAEVEHAWGAVYLIGLARPLATVADRGRSNWAHVVEARRLGALVCYQAGWSREVLLDALLGLVDVVNLCNNNFHRYKFQPRSRYSNLLEVEGLPVYPDTPEGMMRMNMDTYYRLLNCGLRLAAGAGSATGVKSSPAGYNRAYVRAGQRPSLEQFLTAWRQGNNFVTNGPMLFLRAEGDYQPGDVIRPSARGGQVRVRAHAVAQQPLRSLEVISNGKVAGAAQIGSEAREAEVAVTLDASESLWIAARATEEDLFLSGEQLSNYRRTPKQPNRSFPEMPSRLRFAHTSPLYIEVDNSPVRVATSVAEARKMLDAFERFARKEAKEGYLSEVVELIPKARAAL